MAQWQSSRYPGVRFRKHATRKHGVQFDRYFAVRYQANGKRVEEGLGWSSEGWTELKAANLLAELRESQRRGEGPVRLQEKRELAEAERKARDAEKKARAHEAITFEEYAKEIYLPDANADKKGGTLVREQSLLVNWLYPNLGERPLKDIAPIHLERIKKDIADKGRSPRTTEYALAIVRQIFNHALRHGFFKGENPVSKVKKPRVDNRRIRFLSPEEAEALLTKLKDASPNLHDMALLSLFCGLRAGEVFNLTWGNVDFANGTLCLMDTKSGKTRTAYFPQRVRTMLEARTPGAHNERVFPARGGGKIVQVSKSFDRAVNSLGLNDGIDDPRQRVVFHTLRHTYASWLVQRGIDLYTVKELLGHSTISQTERYAHLAPDTFTRAVQVLEEEQPTTGKVISMASEE
ncbi:tyrosine-type recombinase/integrase [Oceanidesulfovibrio marinus]|uniref:Site-specific integrase n=1 Tax=Oceanidesulfovibrio marinus TaxID=370038 RepID=A0A6P1ZFM3_9BACT|nr:site-specific integrase [Oceanidesulfovibrio marinus]TVM32122.1 site-specific integrase [Oceanidesulfovibrio marinus]